MTAAASDTAAGSAVAGETKAAEYTGPSAVELIFGKEEEAGGEGEAAPETTLPDGDLRDLLALRKAALAERSAASANSKVATAQPANGSAAATRGGGASAPTAATTDGEGSKKGAVGSMVSTSPAEGEGSFGPESLQDMLARRKAALAASFGVGEAIPAAGTSVAEGGRKDAVVGATRTDEALPVTAQQDKPPGV